MYKVLFSHKHWNSEMEREFFLDWEVLGEFQNFSAACECLTSSIEEDIINKEEYAYRIVRWED